MIFKTLIFAVFATYFVVNCNPVPPVPSVPDNVSESSSKNVPENNSTSQVNDEKNKLSISLLPASPSQPGSSSNNNEPLSNEGANKPEQVESKNSEASPAPESQPKSVNLDADQQNQPPKNEGNENEAAVTLVPELKQQAKDNSIVDPEPNYNQYVYPSYTAYYGPYYTPYYNVPVYYPAQYNQPQYGQYFY